MKNYLLPLLFFVLCLATSGQNSRYLKVKIFIQNKNNLNFLSEKGFPLDGCYITDKYIIGEFPAFLIDSLNKYSYNYKILIDDMSKHYQDRYNKTKDRLHIDKKKEKSVCFQNKYPTPQNFDLGSVGGYYSYEEIIQKLNFIHNQFSSITSQVFSLNPSSIQNRNIYGIKISDNPEQNEDEPKVLYIALTHAREPMGMQQLFFFMLFLLENYNNPSIKYIIDNCELYFIPCANPDGYVKNNIEYPNGGGMHRKNCRNIGFYNKGVDLNRNYGYMWGYDNTGSSPYPDAETYRGNNPFSEPETQAIKNFIEQVGFDFIIDHHCYSNVLLYPWSYTNQLTPDNDLYTFYSELMTEENGFKYGVPYETIGYNANGCSFDWFYGEQITKPKIIGWGSEAGYLNDGFYPSPDRIVFIASSFMNMNLLLAKFATKYALVKNLTKRYISSNNYIKFKLLNIGKISPADFIVTLFFVNSAVNIYDNHKMYSDVNFAEELTDSFQIVVNNIAPGTPLKFYFKVETDLGYYISDTFEVIYGIPQVLFQDACDNMQNWTSEHWGITNNTFTSAPSCFTDSPYGSYTDNTNYTLILNNNIHIPDSAYTELSFSARWDIEALSDYFQVLISDDNGNNWQLLCGKYSTPSFLSFNYEEPIYEGIMKNWVTEYINISDYRNKDIKIKFILNSNTGQTENDGIYIDDIKIFTVPFNSLSNNYNSISNKDLLYPVPATNFINLSETYDKVIISDILFNIISEFEITDKIDISFLPAGLYYITVIKNGKNKVYKFIKIQ